MRFVIALLILVTAGMIGLSSVAAGFAMQEGNLGLVALWIALSAWNGFNLGNLVVALREW